ncbi:M4 family metallopeptidase [Herbiconiux sp. KACC 21604]|uniref:M4 family metallopeptidase n=1 Tax=unclassified Herbiconiux TaxID=2618217 RepID=UPI001491F35A|nr:M4 family metallopeptidase [Herbiconiux sp. SALV-R1]QJU53205.1 M4 family metallopeptidase [Herbiconiux sp. SALV-R1]WPO88155.1 M4 family metallopeptidase [Herbiconiux sp. KACC 21604]
MSSLNARIRPVRPSRPREATVRHSIVPPYLLERIAGADAYGLERAAAAARRSLTADPALRAERQREAERPAASPWASTRFSAAGNDTSPDLGLGDDGEPAASPPGPDRTVYDAGRTETLPGRVVRREGAPATGDPAADEAYDGLGATHALLLDAFGRDSIDGKGLPLLATVHYGRDYDNAFWDGDRMVFGDGDGEVFGRFTASLSVIGHELAHGVTQYTAGLVYQGQSGALNESFSDVIGALVEQHRLGQTAGEADWLIGAGLFTDAVEGRALRSMLEPGTAYDDDVLGRDPQPADMAGYVDTADDNGGVHVNSGIPNRAFALAAIELGGRAWETVGPVWYDTVGGPRLTTTADFAQFAAATIATAGERYGGDSREVSAIEGAWRTVGVRSDEPAAR